VIRRSALDDVGGVAVETVTEDAHTSLRLQRRGWNTAYLKIPLIGGLATATIADHIGQRIRWARGMVQILRLENPLFARGLTLPQRLCYFNCMIHFLYALPRLIFLTSPLVYLLLEKNNVYGYVFAILAYTFPHLAMAILTNSRVHGRFRHSFWNEVYETVLSPFILLPTLAALINPRWGRFNVTPKGKSVPKSYLDWRVAAPFVILLGLNVAGTVVGVRRLWTGTEVFGTVAANVLWTIINTFILGTAVAACYERRQLRAASRIETLLPARIILTDGRSLAAETRNLSLGGAALAYGQPAPLRAGESIRVALGEGQAESTLPATVVAHRSPIVRVAFEELTLRQHDGLTRHLFGRADTWLRWDEGCEVDRPLVSFFRIARISMLGLAIAVAQPFLILRGWLEGAPPSSRRRLATPVFLLLAAALLLALRASAQPRGSKDAPLPVFHDTFELGRPAQRETLVLKGLNGQSSTQFSISLTKVALHARLLLQYTPSPRLDAESSTLAISLNGSPAGKVAVEHSNKPGSRVETEIELPGDLLMNENTISFALAGKCLSCSAVAAADLRTWIEPSSRLEITGNVLPSPNDTKLLPSPFFDPAQRNSVSLSFFFPSSPDKDTLAAAAVVSSWFGSMANDRTLQFRAAVQHFPTGNVVAFLQPGTEIARRLGLEGKTGPAIALRDNPADPAGKVLAVFGSTAEQMRVAATALAANRLPAHGDFVPIQLAAAPAPRQAYDAPRWAPADRIIPLVPEKPADDQTAYGDGTVRVYFRLPPDLYFGAQTSAPLGVTFQYFELRGRSAQAQVRVNGLLVGTIRVKGDQGEDPISRVLPVPVSALYPRNTLSVEFTAQPGEVVPRATLQTGTWLDIRGVPHFTRLPRLDLFVKAGFPFTRMADLADTAIVVPDHPSAVEIGLLLELSAFLAEQTGCPGLRLTVAHEADRASLTNKDLLVIGRTVNEAPLSAWAGAMPLMIERNGFQLPAHRTLFDRLSAQTWTAESRARAELARQLRRRDQPDAAIVGFASPLAAGRSVVAIAAVKPDAMQSIVESLNRATSEDLFESSVLLHLNGELHAYAVAAPTTHAGSLSWLGGFNYWTHRYLAAAPFVVFGGMFVVAAVLRRQLDARVRRRLEVA
jgi:cellulose synthase (UDP-forming)